MQCEHCPYNSVGVDETILYGILTVMRTPSALKTTVGCLTHLLGCSDPFWSKINLATYFDVAPPFRIKSVTRIRRSSTPLWSPLFSGSNTIETRSCQDISVLNPLSFTLLWLILGKALIFIDFISRKYDCKNKEYYTRNNKLLPIYTLVLPLMLHTPPIEASWYCYSFHFRHLVFGLQCS